MNRFSDGRVWLPQAAEDEPESHKGSVNHRSLAGSAQGRDPGW